MECFFENTEQISNQLNLQNPYQTGKILNLYHESMKKESCYLRFDENESNSKRQKFY